MKRLLRNGTLLGASLLTAFVLGSPAFADTTPGGEAAASAPQTAPAATTDAAPSAATMPAQSMESKPAVAASKATAKAKHTQEALSLAKRKQVQLALNKRGANLKVDGMLGKQSRDAIKKFQSDSGLKATGWPDKATLEKLGV